MRLDQYLVHQKFASSRTKAQEMIERGEVTVWQNQQKLVSKASLEIDPLKMQVEVISDLEKYVSRAGFKMENALTQTGLDVTGLKVLDVGISTGGFTDCLLQNGASIVVGIDVGRDQLHSKLTKDPRVKSFEGLNAKELSKHQEFKKEVPATGFELIVMDVSFISLIKILPEIKPFLRASGKVLALFKPQFEVGPENLNRNGIVENQGVIDQALKALLTALPALGLKEISVFESGFPGRDGNKEYFVFMQGGS